MKALAIIFAVIVGSLLATIQIRHARKYNVPMWGSILSPGLRHELDSIEKKLLAIAALSFLLFLVFVVLGHS